MLFYEPLFLFVFFPVVFTVYLLLRGVGRGAIAWIALASGLFYLWSEPKFFFLVFGSAVLDYWLGKRIARPQVSPWYLRVGVLGNLSLLAVFKYAGFFVVDFLNPFASIFGVENFAVPKILLPIGIFFWFLKK